MTEKKIIPNIKRNIYKIENWNLKKMYITDKQVENYSKKYMHYVYDDLIIFNFDYNLIKPYVVRLLQKKGFYDDYNKTTIAIITTILFIFIWIYYLFNNWINKKIDTINKTFISQINKNKDNLDLLKTENEKIYHILSQAFSGYVNTDKSYNPINWIYKK